MSLHYQASLCPCTSSVGTWTQIQAETMKNMKERKQVPSGHQNAPPCFLTTAPDAAGLYQSPPCPAGLVQHLETGLYFIVDNGFFIQAAIQGDASATGATADLGPMFRYRPRVKTERRKARDGH